MLELAALIYKNKKIKSQLESLNLNVHRLNIFKKTGWKKPEMARIQGV